MGGLRKDLEKGKAIIVCDANVYLHVYSYSPDYSEYAVSCLEAIKDYLIMPSMVEIEYKKHQKSCFNQMSKRISGAKENFVRQISKAQNDSLSVSINLKKLGFNEIDELNNSIEQQYSAIMKTVEDFFEDRAQTLELLANGWGKRDRVWAIYSYIVAQNRVLPAFSLLELYRLCEEGKKRFSKEIPPGYKDEKKDGLSKYGDFIWWKEVLQYIEKEHCDLYLITDDVKEDWWFKDSAGEYSLRKELVNEFEKTGQIIHPYTSRHFFELVGKEYNILLPDLVQCALTLTDESYCERISDKVFDKIVDELCFNGMRYIAEDESDIGSLGIDEFEIVSYQFERGEQTNRELEDVYYVLIYTVTLSGYSYEYWGRDDDTKEIIMSPGTYHEFEGQIQVALKRQADIFVDFENEDSFEDVEIVEGNLEETVCEPWDDADEYEMQDAYDICPKCGKPINYQNDAGNGFCVECTQNEK